MRHLELFSRDCRLWLGRISDNRARGGNISNNDRAHSNQGAITDDQVLLENRSRPYVTTGTDTDPAGHGDSACDDRPVADVRVVIDYDTS